MAEVEQKIKITTEYVDESSAGLAKAKLQLLDFSKTAQKAGKDIGDNLGKGTDKSQQGSAGLMASFTSLKSATLGYVAVATAAALSIYKVVSIITEAQEVTNKFAFALKNSGIQSQLAVAKFKAFASSIQNTTKYNDEAIVSLGTFFTQAGVGYDQLETATKAAIEYASAYGKTLEDAGNAIAGSYNGQARELGKLVPGVRQLTEEQLRAGGAADILVKKFGGTAAQEKGTLMGSLISAKNALGELVEAFSKYLMPVINLFAYSINNISRSVNMLSDLVDKITGDRKSVV